MCGILGVISDSAQVSEERFLRALLTIKHRGPDNQSIFVDAGKKVWFGHRRLSIIDLDTRSDQPFSIDEFKLHIVFNGEIYNYRALKKLLGDAGYRFKTSGDTEVLLLSYHFWGDNFLDHIRGMFSFCIFDENNQRIVCARDRAGEKPFYFYFKDRTLAFSSEIKALLQLGMISKKVNYQALDYLLAYGFTPRGTSILSGINKLPPGNMLTYDIKTGSLDLREYWRLPDPIRDENKNRTDQEYLEELEDLLYSAVREQYESDVPVGILLSGGVDSSLVTAAASKLGFCPKTYTVSFRKYSGFDESVHAKKVADYFDTNHNVIDVDEINFDLLSTLAEQYDDPIFDSSMIPTYLVTKLVKRDCTVALGGDGADELFGGYNHYASNYQLAKKIHFLPSLLKPIISPLLLSGILREHPKRFWLESVFGEGTHVPFAPTFFNIAERNSLFPELKGLDTRAESMYFKNIEPGVNYFDAATRVDFKNYLSEDILVKVDRASMKNSLELRAPFLDKRIIEFAFGTLPLQLKTNGTEKKIILKKLAKKLLPQDLDIVRKQGFGIPVTQWLTTGAWMKNYDELTKEMPYHFRNNNHRISNGNKRFAIVMLLLWSKVYDISFD